MVYANPSSIWKDVPHTMLTIHAEIVSMAISSPKVNVLQDQTIKEIAALLMVVMAPVFNAVPVCTPQILTAPETRSTAAF